MHFKVTTDGRNRLGLVALLERFANEQWLPEHMTDEQAAASVLDSFKRAIAGELELLPDVRRADEFRAAQIPAFAARPAPNDSSQNANGIALYAGDDDLPFAQRQVKAVHQPDSSFGHVSAEGGELASVNAHADGPKERMPRANASTVALFGYLRLIDQSVNHPAKFSVQLCSVRHSVQGSFKCQVRPPLASSSVTSQRRIGRQNSVGW
jgi:hypothetical protein